jgi:hypothetical protein
MAQQDLTLTFQDPGGNPLAGGYITVRLNTDGCIVGSGGTQVAAGRIVKVTLDSTGSATFLIWPNDQLSPAGTVYIIIAYSATGQLAWRGEMSIATI